MTIRDELDALNAELGHREPRPIEGIIIAAIVFVAWAGFFIGIAS